jgi:hypothetical protein
MLTILELGPSILAYRVEGKLDSADVARAFNAVDERLAKNAKIRVYAEIVSLTGMSVNAVWEDFRKSIEHWDVLPRIEKVALVTDIEWLRRAARMEDRMFRRLQMEAYTLAESEEARAWLAS